VRRLLVAAVALAPVTATTAAWACPACATRSGYGAGTLVVIGALIAAPYAIAVVALKVIRSLAIDPPRPEDRR
jgi:hypothetical protein